MTTTLALAASSIIHLSGKRAAVLGVADRNSLAWSIAINLKRAGADVTVGYQHRFYSRVRLLLEEEPGIKGQRCDVMNPDEVENFFALFKSTGLDVLVHGIAFGPETIFTELPSQVNSADFSETLETSVHSLSKIVGFAKPYLNPWASILTLTFQASQRAMPMYGLMGVAKAALESMVRYLAIELGKERIRVNAISSGPVETLAALSEIIAFRRNPEALNHLPMGMIHEIIQQSTPDEDELQFAKKAWEKLQAEFAKRSPIPEVLVADDIAQTVLYFASDLSRKVTGQILYVDCGFSACQLI